MLHHTKTRVIRFTRLPHVPQGQRTKVPTWPGTFDLLGFTHSWDHSQRGNWVVKRKTAAKRLSRALRWFNAWCRQHARARRWHYQQRVQQRRSHDAYDGITGSEHWLGRVRWEVIRLRRNRKAISTTCKRRQRLPIGNTARMVLAP
jgi:RNA-directed DNA polymerase